MDETITPVMQMNDDETVTPVAQIMPELFPKDVKSPYAEYYIPITWFTPNSENSSNLWNVVRFSTVADGNCLFHAICNSYFEPYHTEELKCKKIKRDKIIYYLRKELAQQLSEKINKDPESKTYYELLNNGNTSSFSKDVSEFSEEYMKTQLDSNEPIGYGYLEYIGLSLNKDIYILDAQTRDVYYTDEFKNSIQGNRDSIVLYYLQNHYELVGIKKEDGTFITHFDYNHSFIRFLYECVQKILK